MRKFASILLLTGLSAMPALAAVENYKDVPVVDVNCQRKVAADPGSPPRACALKCAAKRIWNRYEGQAIPEVRC